MENSVSYIYRELLEKTKDVAVLGSIQSVIHWDMETMMPPNAVEQRSLQLELLSRIGHQMCTNSTVGKLLQQIQASSEYAKLGEIERRNVYLINKNYLEHTSLPEKLVADMAKQETVTVNAWKRAKAKKDYSLIKSELKKLFELSRQMAEVLMEVKQVKTPYEALIDQFEPKMSTQKITETFDTLQAGLRPLLNKIQETNTDLDTKNLCQPVSVEVQRQISQLLTQTLGYDTVSPAANGRVDETEHPFTSGSYQDVRITTHYYVNDFTNSIFSILHETGHALYELNVNPEWRYQPVGGPCSYGIHESQSRFYENIVGRSKEFWTGFLPKLQKIVPTLAKTGVEEFVYAINRVERSKIRIKSDEVTYNLHIIIRYEIERDLFGDKIGIDELPQVWNEKYEKYLGIKIKDDAEGVMQDTHWYSGLYGYFPSYALGNIYSGQINNALTEALPNWRSQLAHGNLVEVNSWLKNNIHYPSSFYEPEDLIKKATGKNIDSQPFIQYLQNKYKNNEH
ncbi:MAG: carboxypeptidase M32 [Nitrososphaerota archaeon]|uniref:carboxypeptidase M32 n=1 Tax=Candidatus Bathycorpusculum sp. TaxID=2994959 RepID=UPI002823CAB2|nr:carboxypeptidase M32 [Candidatus Termiticorpusculum sp.]MCL2257633.1 carboxypeptidase M32 [Candidatus Termiticorpusculum sp.]MCL2292242.1 carboxypeptidase M32 [Candidatus Termiticorpusculum sp.]MDR0460325.1 carboxypeptidase M32 [Nitrososphaerota archaeon]